MFKLWHSKKSPQPVEEEPKSAKQKGSLFKRRAGRIIRMARLSEATYYIAKTLGEKIAFPYEYHYEHGDFTIDLNYESRPKLCYMGTCVLHAIYDENHGLNYEIYHADETWENQLLALEEDAKRLDQERLDKENARLAEEYRKNHLPLKDFLELQQ